MHPKLAFLATPRRAGLAVFCLALALRLGAVALVPEPALSPNAEGAFIGGAERLLEGRGFRDPEYPMFSPPLYSVAIAGSFALFGEHTLPIRIAQAVLDAFSALLVLLIAGRVFGRLAGVAAGVLAAFYPFTIYAATYVGTETLFGFFFIALVWTSLTAVRSSRWGVHCGVGLLVGLASLTRGSSQFYPFAWAASLWLSGRRDVGSIWRWTAACACFVAVVSPWTIRNWVVLDAFIPLATSATPLLCGASEEFFTIPGRAERIEAYFDELEERGWERPIDNDLRAWEGFFLRAALQKYRDRLDEEGVAGLAGLFAKKVARLWYATESGRNHALILALNLPFYALALAGIVLAWRNGKRMAWLPAMPVLYLGALHVVVYPYFRYIVPVMPLLLCFAGYALSVALERIGVLRGDAVDPDSRFGGESGAGAGPASGSAW